MTWSRTSVRRSTSHAGSRRKVGTGHRARPSHPHAAPGRALRPGRPRRRPTLGFYLHIDTDETTTTVAYDKLTVKVGSTTLATYSNLNAASGYVPRSLPVGSFAGQTVTVTFTGTEDVSLQTSFLIDDTSLNAG